jgi:hypothetical protein
MGVVRAGPQYFPTPAFAITTSMWLILYLDLSSSTAEAASVVEALSIFTTMSLDPEPALRALRSEAEDGLRAAAITVVFGWDR